MPSKMHPDHYLRLLSGTVSDLQTGLQGLDATEIIYEARILKRISDECEAAKLGETALKIERAAVVGDLDAVQAYLPELHRHLQQTLETMSQSAAKDNPGTIIPEPVRGSLP